MRVLLKIFVIVSVFLVYGSEMQVSEIHASVDHDEAEVVPLACVPKVVGLDEAKKPLESLVPET